MIPWINLNTMAVIYKFGGASVKDADSVKNLANIVRACNEDLIIVVSAMDKITRALHEIVDSYCVYKPTGDLFKGIVKFHQDIIAKLFEDKATEIKSEFNALSLQLFVKLGKEPSSEYDFNYDQIVPYGEFFSTFIVSKYLNLNGIQNKLIDARNFMHTDNTHRCAKIDWEKSEENANEVFDFSKNKIYLTQGFIGSGNDGHFTTLGIEGSDFTAAALAYFKDAEKVVVWKDVAGIYSSDPKLFKNVTKLDAISYQEAVELAYYGAKVIHPKTIKPLQNKNIPLYVKSFIEPEAEGTVITESTPNKTGVVPESPIYITKNDQTLLSFSPTDFSFITENCISTIFSTLAKFRIKVNMMQNSAISFSVCVDNAPDRMIYAVRDLREKFHVLYNEKLTLITIRHYKEEIIDELTSDKEILVEQKSRHTARFVVR